MLKINTIYSHILLILLMSLSSAMTVSAQTFPGDLSGATVVDTYQKSSQTSISIDLTSSIASVFDGTKNTAIDLQNLYIRWEITDANGNLKTMARATWTASDFTMDVDNTPWEFQYSDNYGQATQYEYFFKGNYYTSSELTKYYKEKFSGKNSTFADGYTITAYVSNQMSSSSTTSDVEPAIQLVYKVHLNEKGKKPDAFLNDNNPSASLKSYAKEVTLSDTDADIIADNGEDFVYSSASNSVTMNLSTKVTTPVQYVRYYLQDASGNDVDITDAGATLTLPDGFTQCTSATNGKYWYSATASADVLKNIVLTSDNLSNYKLLCVGAADASTATVDGSTVTKEPVWDFQYTVSFAKPFKGSKKNAKVKNITYTLSASQISGNTALTIATKEESSTFPSFDLYTGNNSSSGTKLYTAESDFATITGLANTTITDQIPTKRFYIRWYLRDKSGSEVSISNGLSLDNQYTNNGYPTTNNKEFRMYGTSYYWYSTLQSSSNNLDRVLSITVNSANIDITKYDVVADISTVNADTYINGDVLSHEPDNIEAEYVFSFREKSFEADNINSIPKVIYKTAVVDDVTMTTTPSLFSNISAILNDLGVNSNSFNSGTYWRWYVEDKATGKKVEGQLDWLTARPSGLSNGEGASNVYGRYASTQMGRGNVINAYTNSMEWNPTVTIPSGFDYHNYNVVCVMTNDLTGSVPVKDVSGYYVDYDAEPSTMQVKYVFSLILTPKEFEELPFVHYKGASDRDYTIGDNASPSQYSWSNTKGDKETATADIRQSVHTWTYDIYVMDGEEKELVLPFEGYSSSGGMALEPRGYIRWYDWSTDYEFDNEQLQIKGALLSRKFMDQEDTRSRGYFAYNLTSSQSPSSANVGVTFKAPASFNETVTVACDVSKYIDGMDGSNTYLVHEPTLSTRYLFRIHPAKEMADKLKAGLAQIESGEQAFKDAQDAGKTITYPADMFNIAEDKSRVAVSTSSTFTLRLEEPTVSQYYLYDASNNIVPATNVKWYAYYAEDGKLYKSGQIGNTLTSRLASFSMGNFSTIYYRVHGPSDVFYNDYQNTENLNLIVDYGTKVHLIGYVTDGTTEMPVAHYELSFCDAPQLSIDDLKDASNFKRTPSYLSRKFDLATTLTFDNFIVDGKAINELTDEAPRTTAENMTMMPMAWDQVQYGFCYPDLYSRMAPTTGLYTKMSPIHGDYILLKSMNVNGISDNNADGIYNYYWWSGKELYDVTHTYTNTDKYGSFIYVDASDESRTMATLEFDAQLNIGSSVLYTAYVADMTGGAVKPQIMSRLYAVKKDADGNITEKIPVMSFHSGLVSGNAGKWTQIFSRGIIPASVNIENYTHYLVEVDNYSGGTDGADFCIDEISFYTSSGEIYTSLSDYECGNEEQTFNMWIGAETLQNSALGISNTKQKVFYRLCESDGTVLKGIYGTGQAEDYGWFEVKTNYTKDDFSADSTFAVGKYFTDDEGDVMYGFAQLNVALDAGKRYYVAMAAFGETIIKEETKWGNSTNKIPSSDILASGKPEFTLYDLNGNQITTNPGKEISLKAVLRFEHGGNIIEIPDLPYDFSVYENDDTSPVYTITNATEFTYTFKDIPKYRIVAKVNETQAKIVYNGATFMLCTKFEMVVTLVKSATSAPSLELGFDDVTYPSVYTRVVRIGLAQVKNIKNGYVLHVPVKVYTDSDGNTDRSLTVNTDLRYVESSDPTTTASAGDVVATISDKEISSTKMYVAIKDWTATVHEGFQYTTDFQYHDASEDATAAADRTEYTMQIVFKIVPEYVNWTAAENTNWNNDANWTRSCRAELYKNTEDNALATNTDAYKDNTEIDASLTQPQTYVPMKFTKVTILGGKRASDLIALTRGTDGLYSNIGADATENIQYDMMVKTDEEMAAEACGHGLTASVYDCEKFYGNWCDQIYFKPNAELLNQQNLVYNKAWIDFNVKAGKWYTLTSPLLDTYAGDMYAPKTTGQQTTEAFQNILFDETNYSRVTYPFYQRSWDKRGSTVYTANDSYTADIKYNSYESVDVLQWSHVYNDATVPYAPGSGFSVRALSEDGTGEAIVRLPKSDAAYTYYDYSDKANSQQGMPVSKSAIGILSTGAKASEDVMLSGNVTVQATVNTTDGNQYYLIGNPYMSAVNISSLGDAWILDDGTVKASTGTVLPLQSFFIKSASVPTVDFTPSMMVDGNDVSNPTGSNSKTPTFTLTAKDGNGASECAVSLKTKEESSVGLLMDASMEGVPFIYTVAGTKLAALSNLSDMKMLPVGIITTDASDNGNVDVSISTKQDLYLIDSMEKTCSALSDGSTVAMAKNAPGRYYLSATAIDMTSDDTSATVSCYSPSDGTINVSSTTENIIGVSLYNASGQLCQTISGTYRIVTLNTNTGVYIVNVETTDGTKAFKVIVK